MKLKVISVLFMYVFLLPSYTSASTFQLNGTGYLWKSECQNCNGTWTQQAQVSNFLGTLTLTNGQWKLTSAITNLGNREYVLDLSVDQNITYVHMTRGIDNCSLGVTDVNGECGSWVNSIARVTSLFPIGLSGYIELSGTKNKNTDYWAFIGSFTLIEIQ